MNTKKFIGRNNELKELNARYNSGRKEFGVIYGRRRIGKSALITHTQDQELSTLGILMYLSIIGIMNKAML